MGTMTTLILGLELTLIHPYIFIERCFTWLNAHMRTSFPRLEDCTRSKTSFGRSFVMDACVALFSPLLIFFEVIQWFHADENFIFAADFQETNETSEIMTWRDAEHPQLFLSCLQFLELPQSTTRDSKSKSRASRNQLFFRLFNYLLRI